MVLRKDASWGPPEWAIAPTRRDARATRWAERRRVRSYSVSIGPQSLGARPACGVVLSEQREECRRVLEALARALAEIRGHGMCCVPDQDSASADVAAQIGGELADGQVLDDLRGRCGQHVGDGVMPVPEEVEKPIPLRSG